MVVRYKACRRSPNREHIHQMRALPSFIDVNRREGLTDWQN
jgi:hypothetical protein